MKHTLYYQRFWETSCVILVFIFVSTTSAPVDKKSGCVAGQTRVGRGFKCFQGICKKPLPNQELVRPFQPNTLELEYAALLLDNSSNPNQAKLEPEPIGEAVFESSFLESPECEDVSKETELVHSKISETSSGIRKNEKDERPGEIEKDVENEIGSEDDLTSDSTTPSSIISTTEQAEDLDNNRDNDNTNASSNSNPEETITNVITDQHPTTPPKGKGTPNKVRNESSKSSNDGNNGDSNFSKVYIDIGRKPDTLDATENESHVNEKQNDIAEADVNDKEISNESDDSPNLNSLSGSEDNSISSTIQQDSNIDEKSETEKTEQVLPVIEDSDVDVFLDLTRDS